MENITWEWKQALVKTNNFWASEQYMGTNKKGEPELKFRFTDFNNKTHFAEWIGQQISGPYYETLTSACHTYADIDGPFIMKNNESLIIKNIENRVSELIPGGEFFWCEASSAEYNKFSLHMVYKHPDKCWNINTDQKQFWIDIICGLNFVGISSIDDQVYSKNRHMRTLTSYKFGQNNRPLLPMFGKTNIIDHLIQVDKSKTYEYFPVKKVIKKKVKNVECDEEELDSVINKYFPDIQYNKKDGSDNLYALRSAGLYDCPFRGSPHKSNNSYVIVNDGGIFYKCQNSDCEGDIKCLKEFKEKVIVPEINEFDDLDKLIEIEMKLSDYQEKIKGIITYIKRGGNRLFVTKEIDRDGEIKFSYAVHKKSFEDIGCMIYNKDKEEYTFRSLTNLLNPKFMKFISKKDLIFEPYLYKPEKINAYFNLFTGFKYKPTDDGWYPSEIKPFIHHIKNIICRGNKECSTHLIKWFAHIIQKPNIKTGLHVVLKSEEHGAGKNILLDIFGELLGKRYYLVLNDIEQLVGKFNSLLENKLLTVCDELSGSNWHNNNKMKNVISQPKQRIEKKGIDAMYVNDYNNYISLTNNDWAVKIESSDRRYFCLNVSNEMVGNVEYFAPLVRMLKGEGLQALFNYFTKVDLEGWNPQLDTPITKMKQELKKDSAANPILFIESYLNDVYYEDGDVFQKDLYDSYKLWKSDEHQIGKVFTLRSFKKTLSKININNPDTSRGRIRIDNEQRVGFHLIKEDIIQGLRDYFKDQNYQI